MFNVAIASLDLELLWWLFLVLIANQKRLFEAINQSDCDKVIDNTCSFFVARRRPLSEKKKVFSFDAKAALSEYTAF